jgi:hypothetical protein
MTGSGRGPDPALAEVLAACDRAVATIVAVAPDVVAVVGSAPERLDREGSAGGTLAEYGLDVRAGGPDRCLPLSLTVGAWLLERADGATASSRRRYVGVPTAFAPEECAELGAALVAGPERVALLVMGDGSARRTRSSPGPYDPTAEAYDTAVEAALAAADADALLTLDLATANRLWVAGRAAWQVLAGAADATGPASLEAEHLLTAAPYGVGYFVAVWRGMSRHP